MVHGKLSVNNVQLKKWEFSAYQLMKFKEQNQARPLDLPMGLSFLLELTGYAEKTRPLFKEKSLAI